MRSCASSISRSEAHRNSRAACPRSRSSGADPHRRAGCSRDRDPVRGETAGESCDVDRRFGLFARRARVRRRSWRRRARPAGRRRANRGRRPSAAGARPDTTCPARDAAGRLRRNGRAGAGSAGRPERVWLGPTASVFHSGDWKSSMEQKVGSPPMVRRTSPSARCLSTIFAQRDPAHASVVLRTAW